MIRFVIRRAILLIAAIPLLAGIAPALGADISWKPLGPDKTSAIAIAIDPKTPATIYVATNEKGVMKSTDRGDTLQPASPGIKVTSVLALAIDPKQSATVYAGTNGGGLFKSTDAAASWKELKGGLANALVIDPANPATVYCGTNGMGVGKTTDGGKTWTPMNNGLTSRDVEVMAIDPKDP
jgi:hypothetical protein